MRSRRRRQKRRIHESNSGIRKTGIYRDKREQERETIDKNTLYYCSPNLHKLVYHVGRVLDSVYIYIYIYIIIYIYIYICCPNAWLLCVARRSHR